MKLVRNAALFAATIFLSINAMAPTKQDIVDVVIGSKTHTTLVTAVKAADLVTTLKGKGPFTLFAPTNDAFSDLPKATLDDLLKPANKSKLAGILTYHVVAGKLDAKTILAAIKKGGGVTVLTTVAGGILSASVVNSKVELIDEKGNKSYVTTSDLQAKNGIVHVIDKVLMPKE